MKTIVALSIVLFASPAVAQRPTLDSLLVYDTQTSTSVQGQDISATVTARTVEGPGVVRMEILDRKGTGGAIGAMNAAAGAPGSYTITADNGRVMYGVNPAKREYYRMTLEDMGNTISQMSKMFGGAQVTFSGMKVKVDSIGPGEVVLGHPTTHWKIQQTMTMSIVMQGDTLAMTSQTTSDSFFATDVPHPASPNGSKAPSMDNAILAFSREMLGADSAKTMAEFARLPRTVIMKSVQHAAMMTGMMDIVSTITKVVTHLQKQRADGSLFVVPKDYKSVAAPIPGAGLEN
jgi:hypothetical protein